MGGSESLWVIYTKTSNERIDYYLQNNTLLRAEIKKVTVDKYETIIENKSKIIDNFCQQIWLPKLA